MSPIITRPARPVGKAQIAISLWLVSHRLLLKRVLMWALALTAVLLYGTTMTLAVRLFRGTARHQAMLQELTRDLIDYPTLHARTQAQPLQVGPVSVLPGGGGRADLAALVINPNQRFAAPNVQYQFSAGAKTLGAGTTFLFPGERKYVFLFGVAGNPAGASLQISELQWQRVVPSEFERWRDQKLRVLVKDIRHQRGSELGAGAGRLGAVTRFTAMNDSIYGYWDVGLYLLLMNGEQLAAAQFTRVRQMAPLSRQEVEVTWVQSLPLYTRVLVVPELNLFDARAFFEYRVPEALPR